MPTEEQRARQRQKFKEYYHRNKAKEKLRSAKWVKENPERIRELAKIRRLTRPMNKTLYRSAKDRSVMLGVEFNLTPEDIIVPTHCPVLGLELKINTDHSKDNSPSVDRIDPNKGYVVGNIRVISHRANTIKNNASLKEIQAVLRYMRGEESAAKRGTQPEPGECEDIHQPVDRQGPPVEG